MPRLPNRTVSKIVPARSACDQTKQEQLTVFDRLEDQWRPAKTTSSAVTLHGPVTACIGTALVNAAMHHNNTAIHSGTRPIALNTAHAVDRTTIARERHTSTMRIPVIKEQRTAFGFLTNGVQRGPDASTPPRAS
jgi:hypothetical protein